MAGFLGSTGSGGLSLFGKILAQSADLFEQHEQQASVGFPDSLAIALALSTALGPQPMTDSIPGDCDDLIIIADHTGNARLRHPGNGEPRSEQSPPDPGEGLALPIPAGNLQPQRAIDRSFHPAS